MFVSRILFTLFAFLSVVPSYAGSPQAANIFRLGSSMYGAGGTTATYSDTGGCVVPAGATAVTLTAFASAMTQNNYYMLSKTGASTGQYQVAGGSGSNKFYICGIYAAVGANGALLWLQLGYGTATLASDGTATAPTGVQYSASGSSIPTLLVNTGASTGYGYYRVPITGASFPNGSWPFIRGLNGSAANQQISVVIEGYEAP